jgi:hypothetical protein
MATSAITKAGAAPTDKEAVARSRSKQQGRSALDEGPSPAFGELKHVIPGSEGRGIDG